MADDDERWSQADEATYYGECDECGEWGPVQQHPDPYLDGLHGGDEDYCESVTAWCYRCFLRRADEL